MPRQPSAEDSATTESKTPAEMPSRPGGLATRIGVVLILLSGVLWFFLFAIPFLPMSIGQKTALAGADFVGVQIAWWSGAALVGPQTVQRIKAWFRRGSNSNEP